MILGLQLNLLQALALWNLFFRSFLLLLPPGMSLVQEERLAFMLCESDGEDGLTWPEVKDCEVQYCWGFL